MILQEIGIYSCVDKDSDESNESVLKILDNKNKVCGWYIIISRYICTYTHASMILLYMQENGIYGIDDDSHQHQALYCNTGCKAYAVNPLSKSVDADPPGNQINLRNYVT